MFMNWGERAWRERELTTHRGMGFSQDSSETLGGEGEPEPHLTNVRKWAEVRGWRHQRCEEECSRMVCTSSDNTCYWKQSGRHGSREWITCQWWRLGESRTSITELPAKERWVPDKTRQGGRRGPQKDEAGEKSAYCGMESFIHN